MHITHTVKQNDIENAWTKRKDKAYYFHKYNHILTAKTALAWVKYSYGHSCLWDGECNEVDSDLLDIFEISNMAETDQNLTCSVAEKLIKKHPYTTT